MAERTAELAETNVQLREEVAERRKRQQRQQALYPVRDAVWDIVSSQDVERLLAAVWGCLVELGIPFERCGVNVVDTRTDPPTVQVRSLGQEGKWIHLGPEFQGNQALLKFWRDQQVVYRRDLAQEDLYGVLDEHRDLGLNPVRSIVDIPFSNGTMAVNSLEPRAFTEQHIADLQAVADVLSEGFRRLDDLQNLEYSNQALRQAHDELALPTPTTRKYLVFLSAWTQAWKVRELGWRWSNASSRHTEDRYGWRVRKEKAVVSISRSHQNRLKCPMPKRHETIGHLLLPSLLMLGVFDLAVENP